MPSEDPLADNNSRQFLWLTLGLGVAVVGCAACCGVGVWIGADRIGNIPIIGDFAEAKLPPPVVETAEEKRASVAAAFGDPPPDGGEEPRAIESFFRRFVSAVQADDAEAFRRLVDGERLWQTIKEQGLIKQLTRGEDRGAPEGYISSLELPGQFDRFFVQAVMPGRSPTEVVAYAILWDGDWAHEYRWWLVRDGRRWRAFDWEPLQLGVRQSRRYAAYAANVPHLNGYDAAWEAINDADELIAEGQQSRAAEKLRLAASKTAPELLEAEHLVHLAFAWARCGRPLREAEVYASASDEQRDAAPGLLLGDAHQAQTAGEYEKALEIIDRFARVVGGGPNVDAIRADCLFALGRTREAAEHYRRALRYSPDDRTVQANFARSLPAERIHELIEYLKSRPEPAIAADELAAYHINDPAIQAALEGLVAEITPDSPVRELMRGRRLAAAGKKDEAADAYLLAYERAAATAGPALATGSAVIEGDEEAAEVEHSPEQTRAAATAEAALASFHDLLWEDDRALEAYERAPDKAKSFDYLMYSADEYGLAPETRKGLIERHATVAPDAPELFARRAEIAAEELDHGRAAELWGQVLKEQPEHPYAAYSLATELLELDRVDEAIALFRQRPENVGLLSSIAARLSADGRQEQVLELASAAKAEEPYQRRQVEFARVPALAKLGRAEEVKAALAAVYNSSEQPWERQEVCRTWCDIAAEAGLPIDGLLDTVGNDAFRDLVDASRGDAERLKTLMDAWAARAGDAESALTAMIELSWAAKDYAGVVGAVRDAGGLVKIPEQSAPTVSDQYVRSLVRSGEAEEAVKAASQAYDITGDATLPMLAAMAAGQWDEAAKTSRIVPPYMHSRLYADEDAGKLLRSTAAASLRRAIRRDGGSLAGRAVAVLLLKQPLADDATAITARLRTGFGEGATAEPAESIRANAKDISAQALLRSADRAFLVTSGTGLYAQAQALKGTDLQAAVSSHNGWIALDTIGDQLSDEAERRTTVAELLSIIGTENIAAIQVLTDKGSFLLPSGPGLAETLAHPDFDPAKSEGGEMFWLARESEEDEAPSGFATTHRALAERFSTKKAGDRLSATVALELPHGRTRLTLPIERVVLNPYGADVTVALDAAAAQLFAVEPGELCHFGAWSLRDWTYEADGPLVRGTDLLSEVGSTSD